MKKEFEVAEAVVQAELETGPKNVTGRWKSGGIRRKTTRVGLTLSQQLQEMLETGKGHLSMAPGIFTERSEGVKPEFDIRTDRWDLAYEKGAQILDRIESDSESLRQESGRVQEGKLPE